MPFCQKGQRKGESLIGAGGAERRLRKECGRYTVFGGECFELGEPVGQMRPDEKHVHVGYAGGEVSFADCSRRDIHLSGIREATDATCQKRARSASTADNQNRVHGIASSRSKPCVPNRAFQTV